jgi:16S rRNA (guanine527-N7)-methyltransferase
LLPLVSYATSVSFKRNTPAMSESRPRGVSSPSPRSDPAVSGSAEAGAAASGGEAAVEAQLGPAVAKLRNFAELLGTDGVTRGLIGPSETPRLWDRHILNSAALVPLLPNEGVVVDVGSGAGLPGMVLGIIRPTLAVILLEPLLRRVRFLTQCVEVLDVPNVTVLRGRAEEHAGLNADVAVARAVAPLAHLTEICLPLLRPAGQLLALKGEKAEEELRLAHETLRSLGATSWSVLTVAPPDAVANATIIRVVAGSRQDQEDQPRRKRRSQKQPDVGRGDRAGDVGRAHGGG